MLIIPDFMNSDDYLQNPVLQNFCSENNLKFRNTRPECIKVIKEYADSSNENEQKTVEWLEKVAKEGTKEICYKEIYNRNLLGGLYRENPVKSRNYEAVKSSKKWENVGNSYIIPALLLYRYSYI